MAQLTGTDLRREALKQVETCVCQDRQNTYGDAEDNFADIAQLVTMALRSKLKDGEKVDSLDVATISLAIKFARTCTSPRHLDNWIDTAGYGVCGAGIVKREQLAKAEHDRQITQ